MKRTAALLAALLALSGFTSSDTKSVERHRALHVLNRLAFGPRPGDVDRVAALGVATWIEQQLHPERVADLALDARLAQFETLQMSEAEILRTYYVPVIQARKNLKQEASGTDGKATDQAAMRREMRDRLPAGLRPQRVMEELQSQRIIRAAESSRQLNEVMVDFWMNHFNVFAGKGVDRFLLTSYERDAIRPHIWGRFEDLLRATAKSPAMLFYLDNARSAADEANRPKLVQDRGLPGRFARRRGGFVRTTAGMPPVESNLPPAARPPRRGGLNENYAREIMELHTLGVDAGYTQNDVTQLARVFTGWSIARPEEGGGFVFRRQLHDAGEKTLLGVHFAAGGGMEEGERMIALLAHHPATAHHIAFKLCQRLVADEPPPALVERVAKRFLATNGDLRETVKAVIDSPEFWSPAVYRSKVKSPFEYAISAIRAVDGTISDPLPIARSLQQGGEPLYGAQPPTGYSDKADVWVNTGALMARLNFALTLAANKMPGVRSDVTRLIPSQAAAASDRSVDAMAMALTGGDLSRETRDTIRERLATPDAGTDAQGEEARLTMVAGLIIGSPEFQKQ
ncbi:MAG: DUF1800 domain-containing protein [Acidobacteriota bacterium]